MRRLARRTAARHAATRETALAHRVAALVLDYPDDELLAMLPDLRTAVATLPPRLRVPLEQVLDHLGAQPPTVLAAQYVETFDLARRRAPYLSYYSHGDTRRRGVALVEYKQAYRAAGFELEADELPDHVAVVLEFASTGDEAAQESGLRLLLAHRASLELLRLALLDAGSPWAGALVAVCATLPPLDGDDREAVARLAAEGPPGEDVGLEPFAPPASVPDSGARR
ncbi:nitrate reductase molybdenum cofactor assembly chaperone [Cellulomonas sp. S1-8]|uniref:nitrate reductase molybdenum cofactor assembly chaperone n=1 Tax=Cellulomonas sp. S1-8 TaxID=2904790 RepID=UPI002243A042|nr:nitrate reductase molybdenum cofactor assembly chaperone [Cellulomonas sp. S1-8]UZN03197.1 nitrate reductase molybdenum cofactor assembly chaperone [Cellulomonas sp. S1-8]